MKTKTLQAIGLSMFAVSLFVSSAEAQITIVNETFGDNERATQNPPSSLEWAFAPNGAIPNGNLSASTGALVYTRAAAAAAQYSTAYFTPSGSPFALAATGNSITLSFQFAFSDIVASENGLRFGLFNSGGTRYAAGFSGSSQAFSNLALFENYTGFSSTVNPGATTGTSTQFVRQKNSSLSSTTPFTGDFTLESNAATYLGLTANTFYNGSLTITRTGASTASITSTVNGFSVTETSAGGLTAGNLSFDTVSFFTNSGVVPGSSSTFTIDNLQVTSNVPEPTTAVLLALGLGSSIFLRRRRMN